MDSRAPRFDKIEIPLTLQDRQGRECQCACLNISSTGALLRFLSPEVALQQGMLFRSKMLQRGQLVEVWMQVERVAQDGVGVRFLQQSEVNPEASPKRSESG
ncbi:PilZ domain-containing protein [Reinekea sp. G2M2-21]|uniref:PilZ domain-containing protein n=1 Tax=Reinekea sp. G2M2-21 TaxID=2788942 RepID=UPI0018AA7BDF|nr:PilZ domain-containing protein [Reinekea sp. G2M2-21]